MHGSSVGNCDGVGGNVSKLPQSEVSQCIAWNLEVQYDCGGVDGNVSKLPVVSASKGSLNTITFSCMQPTFSFNVLSQKESERPGEE